MVLQQTPITHNFSQDVKNLPRQVSFVLSKIYNDFRNGAHLHEYSDIAGIANVDLRDFENTQHRSYRDVNISYTGIASGPFVVGEDIEGTTSTDVATITAVTASILTVKDPTGVFNSSETITSGSTTATTTTKIEKYLVTKLDDTLYKMQWTAL